MRNAHEAGGAWRHCVMPGRGELRSDLKNPLAVLLSQPSPDQTDLNVSLLEVLLE